LRFRLHISRSHGCASIGEMNSCTFVLDVKVGRCGGLLGLEALRLERSLDGLDRSLSGQDPGRHALMLARS